MSTAKTYCSVHRGVSCGLLALLSLIAVAAPACERDGRTKSKYQGWQFEWDNDAFARTDRWFTNGLRFSSVYCRPIESATPVAAKVMQLGQMFLLDREVQKAPAPTAAAKPADLPSSAPLGVSLGFGQLMYTPADIRQPQPQLDDRPWAGALYGVVSVFAFQGDHYQASDLKLGVTGRASQAGQVQRSWHRLIGADRPEGWEQQLKTAALVQLGHVRLWRFGDKPAADDRWGFHLGGAGSIGTHRSYASVLAGASLGWQKDRNPVFAVGNDGDLIIQDMENREAFRHLLLFSNLSLSAVGHNRFITGNTAGGRSQVKLRRAVAAWQIGFSYPLGRRYRLMYTHTLRSPEFEARDSRLHGNPVQRWGTLSLNFDASP